MFAVCSLISSDCSLTFFGFAFSFARCGQTLRCEYQFPYRMKISLNSTILPSGHQEKDFIASCNLIMWDGTRVLSGRPCGNHVDIYPYVNAMYFNCFMVVIKGPSTNAKFIPVGLSMTFYLDTFRSERFKPPQFNPAFGPGQSSGVLVDLNEDGALPLVEPNSRLLQPGINQNAAKL